jgi:menaquinone-dependent protoporphyrinogen oxidase
LGSAVYFGPWLQPATELADRSAAALATKLVWLFSSGPVGDPRKPAETAVDVANVVEATKARDHQLFGGALFKKQLSFPERAMVLALRVHAGDSRDWTEIKAWASGIADDLEAA